jgi:hypothetical protein
VILTALINNQITNQFRLKQLVKFPTRGERTLDLILTNLAKFYQNPEKKPPLAYQTILPLLFFQTYDQIFGLNSMMPSKLVKLHQNHTLG